MPTLRSKNPVVAIACSDLHITAEPPLARSGESDWPGVVKARLLEVRKLQWKLGMVPLLCAGDIFDHWKCTPETINLVLESMPHFFAVPGQHEIPHHNIYAIHRSAYDTLTKTGFARSLTAKPYRIGNLRLYGAPWDMPIPVPVDREPGFLNILVAHRYVWTGAHKFHGAPDLADVLYLRLPLKGYDVAIFGDNHKGFITKVGSTNVINCGTFFRRKADEVKYRPMVGLIHSDGTIKPHYLDTSKDVLATTNRDVGTLQEVSSFLATMAELENDPLNFEQAVEAYLHENQERLNPRVTSILRRLFRG